MPLGEWLLRSAALAALVSVGAWALEEVLRGWSKPTRFVWIGALLVSIALPVLTLVAPDLWPHALHRTRVVGVLPNLELLTTQTIESSVASAAAPAITLRDLLLPAWILVSALCALRWLYGFLKLRRARARWRPARVGDLPVYVSEKLGPALVGLQSPRVVLPGWLLTADAERLAMIVRHETEHARAGDQWLLALAPIAVVLFPWSPALWWQINRLRLAVELDCDARVLRGGVPALEYGSVLLDVAGGTLPLHPTLAAMAEPRSFLERRIRAMTPVQPRYLILRAAALAGVAALALFGAAFTGAPTTVVSAQVPTPAPAKAMSSPRLMPPPPAPAPAAAQAQQQAQAGDPIFVIDGVIQAQRGKLNADVMNKFAVGTIEVLKPEQATRRFGVRGRYGAVVITTRKDEESPALDEVRLDALNQDLPRDESKFEKLRVRDKMVEQLTQARAAREREIQQTLENLQASGASNEQLMQAKVQLQKEFESRFLSRPKGDADEVRVEGLKAKIGVKAAQEGLVSPIYIVDGVLYQPQSSVLKRLDPDLIASVEIMKGQAAVSAFGEVARNGVIIITTKR